ncbi:hypothetical protein OAN01_02010 [Candidatus Pelagibacter sp.]|nr:hypothetical protein [Candidatus Pelagibacter sp.]
MKIAFHTNNFNLPSSYLHKECFFEGSLDIEKFNEQNIDSYDWIFVMSYEEDLKIIDKIDKSKHKIKFALVDPRLPIKNDIIKKIDFIILDSLEMEDFYIKYNLPIFKYVAYPNIKIQKKKLNQKEINLGYHGNLVHLNEMSRFIINALERLGSEFQINLNLLYNFENKKKFEKQIRNIKINHIQWSISNFKSFLENCDLGIVPNLKINFFNKLRENSNPINYSLKFKLSSGPGRIMPFAVNSIPVVCDMYPSSISLIDNYENGFLCYSENAWYSSIKRLSKSVDINNQIGKNLNEKLFPKYSIINQNNALNKFIKEI